MIYQILMKKLLISIIIILSTSILISSKTNDLKIPVKKINNEKHLSVVYNEPNSDIIGFIEFLNYNQINPIKLGTEDEILDQKVVGLHKLSENLDKYPNNIILAAHNQKNIFQIITKLKIHDQIKISSLVNDYFYEVTNIEKVSKNKKMPFKTNLKTNVVTLITCIEKNQKRLIITLQAIPK